MPAHWRMMSIGPFRAIFHGSLRNNQARFFSFFLFLFFFLWMLLSCQKLEPSIQSTRSTQSSPIQSHPTPIFPPHLFPPLLFPFSSSPYSDSDHRLDPTYLLIYACELVGSRQRCSPPPLPVSHIQTQPYVVGDGEKTRAGKEGMGNRMDDMKWMDEWMDRWGKDIG